MKRKMLRTGLGALFLVMLLSLNGCLLLAAGAGAAGGILGYTYFDNGIEGHIDKPVRAVADATRQAYKDMGMTPTTDMVGDASFKFEGKGADSEPVVTEGKSSGDNVTTVKITVGTFESKEGQSKAADLYAKIKSHL